MSDTISYEASAWFITTDLMQLAAPTQQFFLKSSSLLNSVSRASIRSLWRQSQSLTIGCAKSPKTSIANEGMVEMLHKACKRLDLREHQLENARQERQDSKPLRQQTLSKLCEEWLCGQTLFLINGCSCKPSTSPVLKPRSLFERYLQVWVKETSAEHPLH